MSVALVDDLNNRCRDLSPEQILEIISDISVRPVFTTKFGPHSVYLIDMVVNVLPDIKVVWIDTGFNTPQTIDYANRMIEKYRLNIHIFRPTKVRRNQEMDDDRLSRSSNVLPEWVDHIKLKPFREAMKETAPDFWITGIREEQTPYRKTLDIFSSYSCDIIRVAPIFKLKSEDVEQRIKQKKLESEHQYRDITKGHSNDECGIHFPLAGVTQ